LKRLLLILSALAAFFPLRASADSSAPAEARLALRRTPIVAAVEKVQDCVVNISTERMLVTRGGLGPFATGDDVFDRFFQDFFRGPGVEQRKVNAPLGSGCVITSSGLVITNEHVVRRASNVKLSLNTGETFDAVVLAADPAADLALLRAQTAKPLQAIPMGVSSDLMLGEPVIAVGNPFGFESSVTSGIVSALNREITVGEGDDAVHYTGLIQTSALINPGNSGGPLVNILGELIGINSAIVDGAQGIGFAIPIDRARDILAPLLAAPQVCEAWAGLRGATVPGRKGARVTQLEAGGPAEKVLQVNDVIVSLDGRPLGDLFDFFMQIVQHQPGDAVALVVERGGQSLDVQLALGRRPQPSPAELLQQKLGLTGSDLTPAMARQRGTAVAFGIYATQVAPDGPAHRAGLERGDVIIQIGSNPVRNLRDAAAALRTTIAGERVIVVIVRQDVRAFARVTVGE
jgi:serine protease Do